MATDRPVAAGGRSRGRVGWLVTWGAALVDLGLPGECAACGSAPDGRAPLCRGCHEDLAAGLFARPSIVRPDPPPPGLPPVVASGPYAGTLRTLVTAYKDKERRDLRPLLSGHLAAALEAAYRLAPPGTALVVVAVPSSRTAVRRRGDDPVADLARAAAARLRRPGARVATVQPGLRVVRRVLDQSRLGHAERADNLAHAYAVAPRHQARLRGRAVVLVDDVLTSGATLAEAARALRECGVDVVAAATLAATRRRAPPREPPSAARPLARDH